MKTFGNKESEKELERGYKSLAAARNLFEAKLYEDSISRCYYAVLHAAKALLVAQGVKVESHEAAKKLFGLHLVKTEKIDKEFADIFREEQDDRILADYDVAFEPSSEQVEKRILDAAKFIAQAKKYLTNFCS